MVAFAAVGSGTLDARALFAHCIATVFTAGTAMLVLALVLVLALIVRPRKAGQAGVALSQRSP